MVPLVGGKQFSILRIGERLNLLYNVTKGLTAHPTKTT